jgi:hypothetical protein
MPLPPSLPPRDLPSIPQELEVAGAYLTDGTRLLRVVLPLAREDGHARATLEDCRTLDLLTCDAAHLGRMGLHPVRAAAATAGQATERRRRP